MGKQPERLIRYHIYMERRKRNRKGGARLPVWARIVFVILILLLFGAAGFAGFSRPESCNLCHVMQSRVDSWRLDIHAKKNVTCLDCHADRGLYGQTIAHISGVGYVFRMGNKLALKSKVPNSRCLVCHFPLAKRDKDATARLHFKEYLDHGATCGDCHIALAHTSNGASVNAARKNRICGGCHPANMNEIGLAQDRHKAACEDCHKNSGRHALSPHRDNVPSPGMRAEVCLECHKPTDGTRSMWELSKHGSVKLSGDLKKKLIGIGVANPPDVVACSVCHNPHTAKSRLAGGEICLTCHKTSDMYKNTGQIMPGWPASSFHNRHAVNKITCVQCHIDVLPVANKGSTQHGFDVTTARCLFCHPGLNVSELAPSIIRR